MSVLLLLSTSCYREEIVQDTDGEMFELTISPSIQEFISSSRDTSYTIEDKGMVLRLNGDPVELKSLRIRGKHSLSFTRKSYSVFLHDPIIITGTNTNEDKAMKRFKLLAMAMDYTYIENRIGFGLLEKAGILPLFYKFVEFRINGQTEGVYMLVEDPEQYFKEQGSEYILRRYYHHWIAEYEYEPSFFFRTEEEYRSRFNELYNVLVPYEGEELYLKLRQGINMGHYFRKMGIDYLLKNGDYTDEIFLYALIKDDEIQFDIIPWDYDDIFSNYPHEVGVSWGIGTLFGTRNYPTHQDVLDVLGDKLIYSIEDDLDYTIATDPYLYARYEEELRDLTADLAKGGIDDVFSMLRQELNPYYQREDIIEQSQFDRTMTSMSLWEHNMEEKQAFLEDRLASMINQLNHTGK